MKVEATNSFLKIFKKRFSHKSNIQKRFDERVRLFVVGTKHPLLQDHELSGKLQGHRAFSITGNIRVVYFIHKGIAYFVDIGTHNQVYGK